MPTVISVKFKYTAHDLWFDPGETGAQEGDHVICATERGQEIGLATMDAREVDDERLHEVIGESGKLKPVLRVASDEDLDRAEMLADKGDEAFPTFKRLAHESGLDMKPVGVEYLFGGGRVVCYFSAEERVDFRQLVRDLSRELHERIDMRQIGVREEAAIVGGFGHCGQELCCARFGHRFEPVSIRMAKEQDLPLNSTKISGACGRLMCCLRYEFEAYRDFKQRAPKRNAVIETPLGKAKIVEYDTPKEQICLRLENGKQIRVPLSGMVASEAAHRKSEELGCPCRPDTVTRETLDHLQSTEVQMALADLDRQSGVTPPEGFDESDIFVEPKSRRHRRGSGGSGSGGSKSERKSRSRARQGAGAGEAAGSGSGSGSGSGRRHRRKKVQADAERPETRPASDGAAAGEKAGAPSHEGTSRRRRRHHVAGGGSGAGQPSGQGQAPKHAASQRQRQGGSGKQAGAPKQGARRRHPGDHGGAGAANPKAGTSGNGGQRPQGQGGEGSGKGTRRRHRGRGRGNGNGSGSGGSAPSSE